jgi:hypothetical protein
LPTGIPGGNNFALTLELYQREKVNIETSTQVDKRLKFLELHHLLVSLSTYLP